MEIIEETVLRVKEFREHVRALALMEMKLSPGTDMQISLIK